MALISFPLQSNFTGFDEQNNPLYDRAVSALFYRNFWLKYFTDGIFFDPADNFKVSPNGGLRLSVKLGECHIRGLTTAADETVIEILTLDNAEAAVDRTDRIVLVADFENNRSVTVQIRKNWKAASALKRNSNVWELALADVLVKKNTSAVAEANITDLRLNTDLCGVVTEPIKRTNTTLFFTQLQDELKKVQTEWQTQKTSQQSQWQTQTTNQANTFTQQSNTISAWYSGVSQDITKLQTFSFDNLTALDMAKKTTERNGDIITETIINSSSQLKIAERKTTRKIENGLTTITENTKIFAADGIRIFKQADIVTVIGLDKKIVETVSGFNDYSLAAAYAGKSAVVKVGTQAPTGTTDIWMQTV